MPWQPYVLGALLLLALLWLQWSACCSLWRYWSAPLRNDNHRYLSLARLVAGALVVFGQLPVMGQEWFWKGGGHWLVGWEFLILFSDILTSKLAQIVLPALAGRINLPAAPVPGFAAAAPLAETALAEKPDLTEDAG